MGSVVLSHFSKETLVIDQEFPRRYDYPVMKPFGLWLSDESDETSWSSWCADNAPELIQDKTETFVAVRTDNILHLRSNVDVDKFTKDFARQDSKYNEPSGKHVFIYDIDWDRVYLEYDGILITPHQWQRRLTNHTAWYNSWDCASGCFWNMDILEIVK